MILDMSTTLDANDASIAFATPLDVSDPNRPKIIIHPRRKEDPDRRREVTQAQASLTPMPSSPSSSMSHPRSSSSTAMSSTSLIPNVLLQMSRKKSPSSKGNIKSELESKDHGQELNRSGCKDEVVKRKGPSPCRLESQRPISSEENRIIKPRRIHPKGRSAHVTSMSSVHAAPYLCLQCASRTGRLPECSFCKIIFLMDKFCDTVNSFEQRHSPPN